MMAQNVSLRDKLIKMKDYLVTAESEQQANRHKMIDMINEQSNIAQLTDNLDILTQVNLLTGQLLRLLGGLVVRTLDL